MDRQLIAALKALTDASRLRIVGRLAASDATADELAAELGMPLAAVVKQLGRLESAGLLATTASGNSFSLRLDTLQRLGRELNSLEDGASAEPLLLAGPNGDPLPAEDAKILRGYLEGGRLTAIPASWKKQLIVVRWLRDQVFTEDRGYPEKEVNQRLALFHPDVAALRRYMVDARLVTRENGIYRRAPDAAAPEAPTGP